MLNPVLKVERTYQKKPLTKPPMYIFNVSRLSLSRSIPTRISTVSSGQTSVQYERELFVKAQVPSFAALTQEKLVNIGKCSRFYFHINVNYY